MSHEYRVFGYGASLFTHPATMADLDSVELSVERKGTKTRQRGGFVDIRAGNEPCATAKARLRRLVAEKIVRVGDKITIKDSEKSKKLIRTWLEELGEPHVQNWLKVDLTKLEAEIVAVPTREDVQIPVEEQLIVEFCGQ